MVGELFQNRLANFDSRFSDWHHAVKTERNEGDGEGKPGFAAKFSCARQAYAKKTVSKQVILGKSLDRYTLFGVFAGVSFQECFFHVPLKNWVSYSTSAASFAHMGSVDCPLLLSYTAYMT